MLSPPRIKAKVVLWDVHWSAAATSRVTGLLYQIALGSCKCACLHFKRPLTLNGFENFHLHPMFLFRAFALSS
jgi:hypothetical protein